MARSCGSVHADSPAPAEGSRPFATRRGKGLKTQARCVCVRCDRDVFPVIIHNRSLALGRNPAHLFMDRRDGSRDTRTSTTIATLFAITLLRSAVENGHIPVNFCPISRVPRICHTIPVISRPSLGAKEKTNKSTIRKGEIKLKIQNITRL